MLNTVNLIGRLTAAPELQKTSNDKNFCRTTLAVNRRFKNKEGVQEADFVTVIFWGKTAETFSSYAKKGSLIAVEGELRAYSYEGKDKERHYVTEVLGAAFSFLESRATVARREGKIETDETVLEAEEFPF